MSTLVPVRCGNRREHGTELTVYHASAQSVRECYAKTSREMAVMGMAVSQPEPEPSSTRGPSDRFRRWAQIPVGERGYGFYALESEGGVQFYRVERPKEGRWAGRTFVKVFSSDSVLPINRQAAFSVLDRIADGPEEAGLRYARESRRCTRCNRKLTDADSRARGIGPDCYRKAGW